MLASNRKNEKPFCLEVILSVNKNQPNLIVFLIIDHQETLIFALCFSPIQTLSVKPEIIIYLKKSRSKILTALFSQFFCRPLFFWMFETKSNRNIALTFYH